MKVLLPFTPYQLGKALLKNRLVMAPMTRCRAIGHIPNEWMATYYSQRASAGLLITEGTAPSASGLGYARIPGIYTPAELAGWKKVTQAVHQKGGHIYLQLMHCGRASHPLNLPPGASMVAPSAIALEGEIWTDQSGLQPYPVPQALDREGIVQVQQEFAQAARHAMEAGFDGVELHSANGYLLEQFIAPATNQRNDAYGGSIVNRCRFVLETTDAVIKAIGKDKVGIRLSPFGVFNGIQPYLETTDTYLYLAEELQKLDVVYLHLVDHSAMGAPEVPINIKKQIRKLFRNTLILSGGYDIERAEQDLNAGFANLVAFGRPYISNPDLKERLQHHWPLQEPDQATFYTPEAQGYITYPSYQPQPVEA